MNQRTNRTHRTFVCSLLFLDIPGYSKKSIKEQLNLKQRINTALRDVLADVPAEDRIVLEVGNGMVVSFLGHPEEALFVAQYLIRSLTPAAPALASDSTQTLPMAPIRLGINVGPVRVQETDGQYSIAGDGISVAERIVGFAEVGQVMVSQSCFEVVSKLATGVAARFHFEGVRTDENVREYAVHVFDTSGAQLDRPPRALASEAGSTSVQATDHRVRASVVGVSLVLAISLVFAAWGWRNQQRAAPQLAGSSPPASSLVSPSSLAPPVPSEQVATSSPATVSAPVISQHRPVRVETSPKQRVEVPGAANAPGSARQPSPVKLAPVVEASPTVSEKAPEAIVTLIIRPWGEVSVDGRKIGVSPPLKRLTLTPGHHEIEVSNSGFPVFRQKIEAKSGSTLRLEHRFQ
jgi:class 3 adenylate cyclase